LIEKQKVRYSYGILERQFRKTFNQASRQQGITGDNLIVLLERRLDNVVFRLGFADSRAQARQLVQHGHIHVNGHKTDIPSYQTREGDTISWRESSKKSEYYKQLAEEIESKTVAGWLSLDRQRLIGQIISLPTLDEVGTEFDGQSVVEYYSR
jgi:small subunit ribosomal protein S4